MRVLITGGAGYIGSHALLAVLAAGHAAHVVDSLAGARPAALGRLRRLAGRGFGFTRADLRDRAALAAVVAGFAPEAVVHFAGLKAPAASLADPLAYYDANVGGAVALLAALQGSACRRLVFSSSAAVYGAPDYLPVDEAHPLRPTSPYGRTKLQVEEILRDLAAADPSWSVAALRYFNPAGAHASGRLGEDPSGAPDNLVPRLARVAAGRAPALEVFGDDYPTPDGTTVRDYLHVEDLARAHLAALERTGRAPGWEALNLGAGRGVSVLEMVRAFEAASGREIPLRMAPRRPGDVAACWADPRRAAAALGWRAERGVAEICASAWAWQSRAPAGGGA